MLYFLLGISNERRRPLFTCIRENCKQTDSLGVLCLEHRLEHEKANHPLKICAFPDCGNWHGARGLCLGHYQQLKNGRPLTPLRPKRTHGSPIPPCGLGGCTRPQVAKELCAGHYIQVRLGKPLAPIRTNAKRGETRCATIGCQEPRYRRGLCRLDYAAEYFCSFWDCYKEIDASGLCQGHYRQKYLGQPLHPRRPLGTH